MAVNTFVKDSQDPNPLIRALAVRTMGCIRVDKITEYLCDPLQRCLKARHAARGRCMHACCMQAPACTHAPECAHARAGSDPCDPPPPPLQE